MPFHPTGSPVLIAPGDILVGFGPNGMKLSSNLLPYQGFAYLSAGSGSLQAKLEPACDGAGCDLYRSSCQKAAQAMNPSNCREKNDFRLTSCHSGHRHFW
jgi:hypothetical protein